MTNLYPMGDAIAKFFSDDDFGRIAGMLVWVAMAAILFPCLLRCILRRPRYLDPLFTCALVLFLNRIAFGVQAFVKSDVLGDLCRWTSVAAGIFYAFVAIDYIRSDSRV